MSLNVSEYESVDEDSRRGSDEKGYLAGTHAHTLSFSVFLLSVVVECAEEGSGRRSGGQGDVLSGTIAVFLGWADAAKKSGWVIYVFISVQICVLPHF